MNEKFELFMGCLGNGTTVCNKAVEENGDYKHIAHITDYGKIKLYVSADYIPEDAMEKIKTVAANDREKFFDRWNRQTVYQKYSKLLDMISFKVFLEVVKIEGNIYDKVSYLETVVFAA